MNNNASIWKFFAEIVNRLATKNPKFFNILQLIAAVAWVVSGLPGILNELNVSVPEAWLHLFNKVVSGASIAVIVMANLAVQRPVITTSASGNNTLLTDPEKLPFTAAVEKKEAIH